MATALLLQLPGWLASADGTDHWQRGHRGLIASRLIEQLSDRTNDELVQPAGLKDSLARRLRARLRSPD